MFATFAVTQNGLVTKLLDSDEVHHFSESVNQRVSSLSPAQMAQFGVLPVIVSLPAYDQDAEYYGDWTHTVVGDHVASTRPVLAFGNAEWNARISGKIKAMEVDQLMPRGARDTFKMLLEKEATALGLSPEQLYAANIGYRKLVDMNTEIATLRSKLK